MVRRILPDRPSNDCGGTCTFSISPTSASYAATGGSGSVSVTAGAGCDWTAVSNSSFITITSGSSGAGNGTVNYTVSGNTATTERTGTMTIANRTFTVTQVGTGGGGCTNAIGNPGFEAASSIAPWVISGQVIRSTGAFPHSGVAYMIINGVKLERNALSNEDYSFGMFQPQVLAQYHDQRGGGRRRLRPPLHRGAEHVGDAAGNAGDVQQPEQRHGGRVCPEGVI